jgi:hypothetical protein
LIKGSSSSIQFKVSTTNGRPPIGPGWIRQIKHDGYRLMVRRDHARVRLLTRNGDNWSARFPLILEAASELRARSCLIDGDAVCCNENGLAVFERLRHKHAARTVVGEGSPFLQALWGTRVSPSTVSDLNKKIYATIEAWRNRPIEGEHRMFTSTSSCSSAAGLARCATKPLSS